MARWMGATFMKLGRAPTTWRMVFTLKKLGTVPAAIGALLRERAGSARTPGRRPGAAILPAMATGTAMAAAAVLLMASGQFAAPPDPAPAAAQGAALGEIPAPPAAPRPLQRVVLADGSERQGYVLGRVEGGVEFENERGARYAIPLAQVARIEPAARPASAPRRLELSADPRRVEAELTLAFDVRALELRHGELRYGDKAAVLAVGVLTTALGLFAFEGDTRTAVAAVGLVEAATGATWLGVTWLQACSLDEAMAQKREALLEARRAAGP